MTRDDILKKLEENRETIRGFGVRRLGIFGSYARDEQSEASDIDFLVEFDRPTFKNYFGLKFFLEGRSLTVKWTWSSTTQLNRESATRFWRKQSMPRDYRLYMDEILESCRRIRKFTERTSFHEFKLRRN